MTNVDHLLQLGFISFTSSVQSNTKSKHRTESCSVPGKSQDSYLTGGRSHPYGLRYGFWVITPKSNGISKRYRNYTAYCSICQWLTSMTDNMNMNVKKQTCKCIIMLTFTASHTGTSKWIVMCKVNRNSTWQRVNRWHHTAITEKVSSFTLAETLDGKVINVLRTDPSVDT